MKFIKRILSKIVISHYTRKQDWYLNKMRENKHDPSMWSIYQDNYTTCVRRCMNILRKIEP